MFGFTDRKGIEKFRKALMDFLSSQNVPLNVFETKIIPRICPVEFFEFFLPPPPIFSPLV